MSYFTFTQLNSYLDQFQDIGFRLLIAIWKALNIRKPIAQFLRRNFASHAFKENLHILPWQCANFQIIKGARGFKKMYQLL